MIALDAAPVAAMRIKCAMEQRVSWLAMCRCDAELRVANPGKSA
jgi:hypothetical protein